MNNALSPISSSLSSSRLGAGINVRIFAAAVFLSFLFLLFFYIFQANNFVSGGYSLQGYQKTISELTRNNEKLEATLASLGALDSIESKISELGFEKISEINYIQIMETSVASAK
jgi:hypothetical protein